MNDDAAAQKAITELDGTTVEGRAIKVNEAKAKPERQFGDRSGREERSEGNFNNAKSYNQNRY